MPIPSDQELIYPLFLILMDGNEHGINDLSERIATYFAMDKEEKDRLIEMPEQFQHRKIKSLDQHIALCLLKIINMEMAKVTKGRITFNANYETVYLISEKGREFYEMNREKSEPEFGKIFESASRKSMEYLNGKGNRAPSE